MCLRVIKRIYGNALYAIIFNYIIEYDIINALIRITTDKCKRFIFLKNEICHIYNRIMTRTVAKLITNIINIFENHV